MATRRYMYNKGDTDQTVTEAVGAAVVSKSVELTFDLAASPVLTRRDVLLALEAFKSKILRGPFPPA